MIAPDDILILPKGSYIRYKGVAQVYRFKGFTKINDDSGVWQGYYGYVNDATGDTYARRAWNFQNFTVVS